MTDLRDVPLDTLEAALAYAGCPICYLCRERERRFIANVLGDWVVAAMVRAEFIDALGYCPTHAWLQQSIEWKYDHDGSTTADMYRYVLLWNLGGLESFTWLSRHLLKFQQMFPFVRRNHENGSRLKPDRLPRTPDRHTYLPAGLVVKGQCPICEASEQSERSRLRGLLERLASPDFLAKYRAADGLCLPHLNQAMDMVDDPQLRRSLIQAALEKLEATAGRLQLLVEQPRLGESPSQAGWSQYVRHQTYSRAITRLVGSRPAANQATAAQHLPQSLDEALTLDACPLCLLTAASRQDDLKQRLTTQSIEGSLCPHHAWQIHDLAVAQSYEFELAALVYRWTNQAILQLRADEANGSANHDRLNRHWDNWITRRVPRVQTKMAGRASTRSDCPMCRSEAAFQEEHLAHFLERLSDVELRQRYVASRGLCLPHLRAALQAAAHREDRLFLAATARDRVASLIHLIEEYERKHIWNYRDEPKLVEEQSSWIRAVAFEVGES